MQELSRPCSLSWHTAQELNLPWPFGVIGNSASPWYIMGSFKTDFLNATPFQVSVGISALADKAQ